MSEDMAKICDEECGKDTITKVNSVPGEYVSSLFLVPKKGGQFRPVVNLKGLNQFVAYQSFRLENLNSLRPLVQLGDWMINIDL